ncbi:MAG: hypothetical protein R3330_14455, partial [Saprospiraceae bacterium]|nr:hypothetical protein [Saprospiraceae bacterium]
MRYTWWFSLSFCCLSGFLIGILACQSSSDEVVQADLSNGPEPVVIRISADQVVAASASFDTLRAESGALRLRSAADNQWLQFELPIPVSGRYRSAVMATALGPDAAVSIEDYVGNPDGRTYHVTGAIPVGSGDHLAWYYREGSPFAAGKHPIRLHFNQPGIVVEELRFTLMRRHKMTPVVLTQQMDGDTWELAWSDEFDGSGPVDTSKWTFDFGDWGWGNNELQYYTVNQMKNARR